MPNKILLIFLCCISIFFYRLGDNHLTNWDESWYADVSRTMAEGGNLLTPMWNGRPFFDKPPLFYWMTTASFQVFGITEFSDRFVSALAATGTVILVYLFTGANAAVVLLTTIGFLSRSRTGNLDSLLTFFLFLAIFSYYRLMKRRWGWMVFGLSLGAAFLTKGMIAFGFPLVVLGWSVVKKQKITISFWNGLFLSLVISGTWVVATYMVNGNDFLNGFFQHQGGKVLPRGNPLATFSLTYLGYLKSGLKLWIFFLPVAILALRQSTFSLIILYVVVYFGFISFSENKSDWFLMPIYPVFAMIIGIGMRSFPRALIIVVSIINVLLYREAIFPPDVAGDEARLARTAGQLTRPDDVLYLTNYYFPTTRFYSRRQVFAIYADVGGRGETWWILPKSEWKNIVKKPRVFIVSTKEEFANLHDYLNPSDFAILASSGDKVLLGKKNQ